MGLICAMRRRLSMMVSCHKPRFENIFTGFDDSLWGVVSSSDDRPRRWVAGAPAPVSCSNALPPLVCFDTDGGKDNVLPGCGFLVAPSGSNVRPRLRCVVLPLQHLPRCGEHGGRAYACGIGGLCHVVRFLSKHGEGGGCCAVCVCFHNVPRYRGKAGEMQDDLRRIVLCDNVLHLAHNSTQRGEGQGPLSVVMTLPTLSPRLPAALLRLVFGGDELNDLAAHCFRKTWGDCWPACGVILLRDLHA